MMLVPIDLRTSERVAVFAFNVSGRLLYLNERAQTLNGLLSDGSTATTVPPEIAALCQDVAQAIRSHGDLLGSGQVRREARRGATWLVLKGFTIPGPQSDRGPLILVLAELATSAGSDEPTGCESFGLTNRERDVLTLLGHGVTTLEIAAQLGITEDAAEDHINTLMQKANVTSRTAVLTEFLRSRAAKMRHLTCEEEHGV